MAIAHSKDQFEIDWTTQQVTCPEGKRSASWSELTNESRGDYIAVRFSTGDCQGCPARTLCTKGQQRNLTLHPQREHLALEKTRALMQTYRGKKLYAKRAGVEGTMSQAVRRCGMRRTRYRGLAKTHLGHLAAAAALNLSRVAAWLSGQEPAKTRVSRFMQLMKAPAVLTT